MTMLFLTYRYKTFTGIGVHLENLKWFSVPTPYEYSCASEAQRELVTRIRETSKERIA